MKIFALDTSSSVASVAILCDKHLYCFEKTAHHGTSQTIFALVDEALTTTGFSMAAMDGLAFGKGPGSFTGLRVGASVLQAFSFAQNTPVVVVSSLQALAKVACLEQNLWSPELFVMRVARSGFYYWQLFEKTTLAPLTSCRCDSFETVRSELGRMASVSVITDIDSPPEMAAVMEGKIFRVHPSAKAVALLGEEAWMRGERGCAEEILPDYVSHPLE